MNIAMVKYYKDLQEKYPGLSRACRYIISGGTAAFVDLGLLYILATLCGLHYLPSAIIAFILAFFVSFFLQKFWTFNNTSRDGVHKQIGVYLIIALTNLVINTFLMFVTVHYLNFHYMLAQFLIAGVVALWSFFIYRKFVFKT